MDQKISLLCGIVLMTIGGLVLYTNIFTDLNISVIVGIFLIFPGIFLLRFSPILEKDSGYEYGVLVHDSESKNKNKIYDYIDCCEGTKFILNPFSKYCNLGITESSMIVAYVKNIRQFTHSYTMGVGVRCNGGIYLDMFGLNTYMSDQAEKLKSEDPEEVLSIYKDNFAIQNAEIIKIILVQGSHWLYSGIKIITSKKKYTFIFRNVEGTNNGVSEKLFDKYVIVMKSFAPDKVEIAKNNWYTVLISGI